MLKSLKKQERKQRKQNKMAIIKKRDLTKMPEAEMKEKLKDLRMELMKNYTQRASHQNTGKAKEIRRTVARILTALGKKQTKQ